MTATVTGLFIYPVKSLGRIVLTESGVDERGLAWDRRWMVVDPSGQFITQRQVPAMATLTLVQLPQAGAFRLASASGDVITISALVRTGESVQATVWKDTLPAQLASPEADAFLTRHLGVACRLAFMGETKRQVDPRFAEAGRITSFADGFPVLLTNTASLDDLNRRIGTPVPMERFRPNIVIEGPDAFAEDGWGTIGIGSAIFEAVKPCTRCIITTIDQDTGKKTGKEPLKTLASFRNSEKGVRFGENLIVVQPGEVRIGDRVEHLLPRGMFPRSDYVDAAGMKP